MNKYIKIILLTVVTIFLVFLLFKNYLDGKNNIKNAIFSIVKKENIDLDSTSLKNHDYKNIENSKIVGNGFFINKNGEFLTSKHILANNSLEYLINIENKNYEFDVIKTYEKKDIILGKIKKYKNSNFIKVPSINNLPLTSGDLSPSDKIFTIKNNKKLYGKILEVDQKIEDLNLDDLVKTNLKLAPGDSGSPLFNISGEIIGINSAINKLEHSSFAQKL